MKKVIIILGFLGAILAVVLAVTPLYKLSVFPLLLAFLCGLGLLFLKKKQQLKTKAIQYIFLLCVISLSFTVYKSIFQQVKVENTQEIEKRADESEEDAIRELEDIEIDI